MAAHSFSFPCPGADDFPLRKLKEPKIVTVNVKSGGGIAQDTCDFVVKLMNGATVVARLRPKDGQVKGMRRANVDRVVLECGSEEDSERCQDNDCECEGW